MPDLKIKIFLRDECPQLCGLCGMILGTPAPPPPPPCEDVRPAKCQRWLSQGILPARCYEEKTGTKFGVPNPNGKRRPQPFDKPHAGSGGTHDGEGPPGGTPYWPNDAQLNYPYLQYCQVSCGYCLRSPPPPAALEEHDSTTEELLELPACQCTEYRAGAAANDSASTHCYTLEGECTSKHE